MPRGLVYLLYVIKSPQSSMPIACDIVACGSITDIKFALTEKALRIFCETYHILDVVHPQLPNLDQTIHEMPTGKIGLSVIGAAKVSHFEVLCRAHGFEPTVGLFRCLYVNSKNKGWMSFTCPASFPWNTSKSVPKDPFPKSSEFNAKHYATLVAHPAPFHKYPEPFLCLVGISRYYTLDENTYPQFLRDDDEDGSLTVFFWILHLCPLCNAAMEDVQHVFFRCDVARVVLRKICRWWDLDWQEICSFSDWDA
ncbi:hypothetical protein Tco_0189592 [Tanacetum coccineum]